MLFMILYDFIESGEIMYKDWYDVFPEIKLIDDAGLRKQVIDTCEEALQIGRWQLADVDNLPFTLLIPDTMISYRTHVRTVTRMAIKVYEEWAVYGEKFTLNKNYLIAGALLHDVGKLIEYEKNAEGKTQKSKLGKNLRHPFSGSALAVKNGLPFEIAHIIANHAKEGDGTLRSPEAVIVNKCDMMNFDGLKAFAGMI